MEFNINFKSIEFSGISKLVKPSKFLRHKVDIGGNLKLINFSGFLRFQFGVKVVHYKTFLLIIRGSK